MIELDARAGSFQFDYGYIVVQFNANFEILVNVNFIDVNILFGVFERLNKIHGFIRTYIVVIINNITRINAVAAAVMQYQPLAYLLQEISEESGKIL